jgi:hypothetical protein
LQSSAWAEIGKHVSPETLQTIQNIKDICGEAQNLIINNASSKNASMSGIINTNDAQGNNVSFGMTNVELEYDKEAGHYTFTARENSSLNINIKGAQERAVTYTNIKEGGTLKVDTNGTVFEANLVSSQTASFEFGNQKIDVPANTRVVYKNGKITLSSEEHREFNFTLSQPYEGNMTKFANIRSNGTLAISWNEISGKQFWLEDVEVNAVKENAVVKFDTENAKHFTIQDTAIRNNDIRITTTNEDVKIYLDGAEIPQDARNAVSFKGTEKNVELLDIKAENMRIGKLGTKFDTEMIIKDGKIVGDPERMHSPVQITMAQQKGYTAHALDAEIKTSQNDLLLSVNEKDRGILRSKSGDKWLELLPEGQVKKEYLQDLKPQIKPENATEMGGWFGIPKMTVQKLTESWYDGKGRETSKMTKTDIVLQENVDGKTLEGFLKKLDIKSKEMKMLKQDPTFSKILAHGLNQNSEMILLTDAINKFTVVSLKEGDRIIVSIIVPKER